MKKRLISFLTAGVMLAAGALPCGLPVPFAEGSANISAQAADAESEIWHAGLTFKTVDYYKPYYPDTDSLKKLGAALPQMITVTNYHGDQAKLPTDTTWKYDEKKRCWYNSAVNTKLPEKFSDPAGLLDRIEIAASAKDSEYYKFNNITADPQSTTCGEKAAIEVQIAVLFHNKSTLSHIEKGADGEYYCKKQREKQDSSLLHRYEFDVSAEDSGEYISLYYSSSYGYDTAYASNGTAVLNVEHKYSSKVITPPSCTEKGSAKYTCACGDSRISDIDPTGHNWQISSCDWTQSGETYSCKVEAVCKNNSSHKLTETAAADYRVTKPPTCTQKGAGTYTAVFKDADLKAQTKTVEIAAVGHSWSSWRTSGFDVKKGTRLMSRYCIRCSSAQTEPVENEVTRFAGANRYSTAAAISQNSFGSAKTVILASGADFADALAGVPLAISKNAPILLTTPNKLSAETLSEIKRLGAQNVIILGGKGAVSAEVESALTAQGLTAQRLAGAKRFATATAIAQSLCDAPTDIFFVYAFDYADALSASTAAARKNAPLIYLATNGELDADTKDYLEKLKAKGCVKNAYVIGGEGVISGDMLRTAANALGVMPTRLSGSNRYETCTAVNNAFADVLDGSMICIATGCDFPDALSGGVYAAMQKAPLFLENSKLKTLKLSQSQKDLLKAKKPQKISIFGGTGAVPDSHAQLIADSCV